MKTKYFYNAFNILYDLVKESLGIFQKEELYRQLFQAIYVMSGDALYDNDSIRKITSGNVGDCESQKTVTKNFLTHEVSINEGDAPKYYVTDHHVAIIDRHTWNQAQMMLLGGEEARDKKEKKRRANNASPFTNLTYGVDGCNEPMFRIGYNTPLYTYTDERSAKAEP